MARAVQLASDLSQVGLTHHRPPHLWKLSWLGAMAPGGIRTGTSHVSSPVPPFWDILPEDTTYTHGTDQKDHRDTGSRDGSLEEDPYLFPIHHRLVDLNASQSRAFQLAWNVYMQRDNEY